ncbi:cysteine hydrolase [Noviherbaspirillum autotrophicum]|nr:cysteine hydrolase [Noviherbaspirillum autotrophicum]
MVASTSDSRRPDPTGRSALLMIEFVNEWLNAAGKLRFLMAHNESAFAASVEAGKRALQCARAAGIDVIHATLKLSSDYRELGQAHFGLRGAIPKANTWTSNETGWQFHKDFTPQANEFVVEGRTGASAFASSNLDVFLRNQGISRLYLAGYATHVCIESTMRHAHDIGYEPVIIEDATAAFTEAQQRHVIEHTVHHFGWSIKIEEFASLLGRRR